MLFCCILVLYSSGLMFLCAGWSTVSKNINTSQGGKRSELVNNGVFYSATSFVLALDSRLSVCLGFIFAVMLNVILLFVCWIIENVCAISECFCPEVTHFCWSCDLQLTFWMAGQKQRLYCKGVKACVPCVSLLSGVLFRNNHGYILCQMRPERMIFIKMLFSVTVQ